MIGTMKSAGGRFSRLDVAIAVVASGVAAYYMAVNHSEDRLHTSLFAIPLFLALTVPLLWRRVAPLQALEASLAALLLHVAVFTDGAVRCGIAIPVGFVLTYSAAARLNRRQALFALALGLGITLVPCVTDGPGGASADAMLVVGPVTLAVWAIGRVVHSRARLGIELEQRTSDLREARDERARLEVAGDRARVSSELDALLQRRLGELAQMADGGMSGDPEAATAALAEIERQSRLTLDEMRTLVGVLRSDESTAPVSPQPTLTHLEALLMRAQGPGAVLKVEGSPRAVPAGVELSAYRVVERLLDALERADDVEVAVRFADSAIEIAVRGPMRRRGEESIERARERVRLHGGTLEANVRGGRAEAVASLPVFAAV
jgi:signal transduction histidine kinase